LRTGSQLRIDYHAASAYHYTRPHLAPVHEQVFTRPDGERSNWKRSSDRIGVSHAKLV
jgi:hypothetical protein